ncbi:hypothetical protein BCY91_14160 [Pelobium manganitolerans]|uniref:Uncharacterized protein n=1 Tax=Pelobium manganitolerans TaxID=1842495 RepID=A0A419S9Z1_9SPHI|nr:hypothetical protein [Pelobium manganitolerans]RKD19017.1 hypothetical protein BCY91_14160 [Pelobium manganitolerans]
MKKLISLSFFVLLYIYVYPQQQVITVDSIAIGRKPSAKINLDGSITARNFNGKRAITGSIATGQNPNTNDIVAWLNAVFYPSQVPTASISGGSTMELRAAGTQTVTLNWTAGRQAATEPLYAIMVSGNLQTFTQPSAPGTVSGTQAVTITYNTNQSFSNTVTTTDGKSASATTTFTYLPQSYRGFISDVSGIGNSSSDATIRGLAYGFTTSRAMSYTTGSASNKYFVYAYPASFGDLAGLSINGFPSLASMTKITRAFTNASGYTQNYNIYYTNNAQTTSGYPVVAN